MQRIHIIPAAGLALFWGLSGCQMRSFSPKASSEQRDFRSVTGSVQRVGSIEQLILWEKQANVQKYRSPLGQTEVPSVSVSEDQLKITWLKGASQKLKDFFLIGEGRVRWAKHPFNRKSEVPFFGKPKVPSLTFDAWVSASRSLFFKLGEPPEHYSIKLPTSHTPENVSQDRKWRMQDESKLTVPYSQHIKDVDDQHGLLQQVVILTDVAVIVESRTLNGFTIRDLSPIDDKEHYYLPAFSFDYVGREIMDSCLAHQGKESPSDEELREEANLKFWIEHYSKPSGRAKAHVLLKYGILQSTPNAQNWLVQLKGKTMCPTGKVVIRDIVDSKPFVPLIELIGYSEFLDEFVKLDGEPTDFINLKPDATHWMTSLEYEDDALEAHEKAFFEAIGQIYGESAPSDEDEVERLISNREKTLRVREKWLRAASRR